MGKVNKSMRRKGINYYIYYQSVFTVVWTGSPPPQASVAPPSWVLGREPNSLHAGEGVGAQFRRLESHSGTLYIVINPFTPCTYQWKIENFESADI